MLSSITSTHWAMIASSRPTGPTPSPVFAFTPTASCDNRKKLGDPAPHGLFVRRQLGPLGEHDAIEVDDRDSRLPGPRSYARRSMSAESRPRFSAVGIGKQFADVAQRRGAQQAHRSPRAAARRRRCGRPPAGRAECRCRPAATGRRAQAGACRVRCQRGSRSSLVSSVVKP